MLLEFSVKNMFSIKDKITINMEASNIDGNEENIFKTESGKRILKTMLFTGPNASGKSNLFRAFSTFVWMVRNSSVIDHTIPVRRNPFKMTSGSEMEESSIDIKVLINDIKYEYGYSFDNQKIKTEYLYYYPNNKIIKIFERTNSVEYKFREENKKILNDIKEKTSQNKLFLSTSSVWNFELVKPIYEFIVSNINVTFDIKELQGGAFLRYLADPKLKEKALIILKQADINICDFKITKRVLSNEEKMQFPEQIRSLMPEEVNTFQMSVILKYNDSKYEVDFTEESEGTKIIIVLLPFILNSMESGNLIVLDELDRSLHPEITKYLITLYNDSDFNKNGAQLIFNTHDSNLLDLDIFRRDQINFVEKDSKSGATKVISLREYSPRTIENIEKNYLNGRYGGFPNINYNPFEVNEDN